MEKQKTEKKTGRLKKMLESINGKDSGAENRDSVLTCPMCEMEASSGRYAIYELAKALEDNEIRELYRTSPGLCRTHLLMALDIISGDDEREFFLKSAIDKTSDMVKSLEEYFRKTDYRYSSEPKGEEQTAWLRAMQMYNGFVK